MKRGILIGIFLISLAGVLWGAMGTAVQYLFSLGDGFSALSLVTLRQLAAGALFVAAASLFIPRRMWGIFQRPQSVRDIAVSGALIFGAHYTFFESISYSNAGTAAILLTTVPLFAGIWTALREGRMVSTVECVCFVLASAGVMLIITNGDFESLRFSPLALAWGLLSAVLAAAYSIQPLSVIRREGVVPVVSWGILAGGLIASVFCPPWTITFDAWTMPAAGAFAFIVLFGTVAAFWAYLSGLRHVTPVIAGLLNCMEPLSAFFFSIILLGDRLAFWQVTGVILVISNVILLAAAKARK